MGGGTLVATLDLRVRLGAAGFASVLTGFGAGGRPCYRWARPDAVVADASRSSEASRGSGRRGGADAVEG
jgi:hypothetical protein